MPSEPTTRRADALGPPPPTRAAPVTGLPLLRDRPIQPGERWIYSAGFNVSASLASPGRIDTELADLGRLLDAGARVAILSHQGSHRDGTAHHLDHVAGYLTERLGRPVRYVPESSTPLAVEAALALPAGSAALFGNTRLHPGEETNDSALAGAFARLGDLVAVGGFSKAHRMHASNAGLLDHRPGYLTDSMVREIAALAPWAQASDRPSIAVLGGIKPEKTLTGFAALSRRYHVVVPGGALLNTLLRARGIPIGASALGDRPDECLTVVRRVLGSTGGAEIVLPEQVVVARPGRHGYTDPRLTDVEAGVGATDAIVDFVLPPIWRDRLTAMVRAGARCLVAGPPGRYLDGFRRAGDAILDVVGSPTAQTLLMGGDTVAELPWSGPTSTGGGSALHYLAHGSTPLLDRLRHRAEGTQ